MLLSGFCSDHVTHGLTQSKEMGKQTPPLEAERDFVAISCNPEHKPNVAPFVSRSVTSCGHFWQVVRPQVWVGPCGTHAGWSESAHQSPSAQLPKGWGANPRVDGGAPSEVLPQHGSLRPTAWSCVTTWMWRLSSPHHL